MSNPTAKERAAAFVGGLRRFRDQQDRGALAALRRGLSPATVMDAWPIVARLGGDIGQPGDAIFVDLAALFATHPAESPARNFGETCRTVAWDPEQGCLVESHERRFRRLLAADTAADLTGQLRPWVRLAERQGVGLNYESLFADLWNWRWYADDIRVQWARAFWRTGDEPATPTPATPTPATPPPAPAATP